MFFLLAAAPESACLAGGFCVDAVRLGPPPGLMFLVVGAIGFGGAGLWQEWRARRQP